MPVNLFGEEVVVARRKPSTSKKGGSKKHLVGCEHCPLNKVPGLNKVKGLVRITGRKAFLWAQSPGRKENELKRELVGAVGKFTWEELSNQGMTREQFDIQNVLRCRPANEYGVEHPPTKDELRCCSIYNDEAIQRNAGNAVVHLIMGKVAGVQLLGKAYRKKNPVFWHEPWNAYVVLVDHPSYLLRIGGRKAGWAYYTFRDRLKALNISYRYPGRYGYIKKQNYQAVSTEAEMDQLEKIIKTEVKAGRRISIDIEDGIVDGKKVLLVVGFGWGKYAKGKGMGEWDGGARSVVLFHPENKQPPAVIEKLLARVKKICEDPLVKKSMQHGSYDVRELYQLAKIRVTGYNFDTQYAMYLKHPHLRTYSIESLINFFLQEFQDYKRMTVGYTNFAEIPLADLVLYNCADCDVTKRAEEKSAGRVNQALLEIYIKVAFVLEEMEARGPYLDWEAHKKLSDAIDKRMAELRRKICQVAEDPEFNPDASKQVAWLLYDKLKLPVPEVERIGGKKIKQRSTVKDVLTTLLIKTKSRVIPLILSWRELSKMKGTYLNGYARSAELNEGGLRTTWWLTGAVTGRLRSGKGEEAEKQGILNLQNLHGNKLLKNMLVSDRNWRLALDEKSAS